jgi:hypothetical protein
MKIKVFTSEDYDTVMGWFKEWDWPTIPPESLPPGGFVMFDETHPEGVCAAWVYFTDSNLAWLEWVVSNKKADKMTRKQGLDELVKACVDYAKMRGAKAVFSSCKNESLKDRYKRLGALETDQGVSHFIWRL